MAFDHVIVGLGNPGPKYAGTRHNVGAYLVDRLAAESGIPVSRRRYDAHVGDGFLHGKKTLLAIPDSFMNVSGQPVRKMLGLTGTPTESLIVAHDDLDLPCGRIRLRFGGGAGGHNGIRSLVQHLRSGDFLRLKIGIGRPPEGTAAEKFVLQSFSPAERALVHEGVARALAALETALKEGPEKAMSLFNSAPAS